MPNAQLYYTSLTSYGLEVVQKASFLNKPLNITHLAVGDGAGQAYEPSSDMNSLKGEKYRGEINRIYRDEANPSLTIFEASIPATSGGYTIREAGLFDEEGKLFAIAKLADTVKPKQTEGEAKELYIRLIIEISNAANITFNMNSSAVFATHEWVNDHMVKKIVNNKEYRVPSQYATVQDCLADLHDAIITDDTLVSIILEKGTHIWDSTVEIEHINGSRIQMIGEEEPTSFPTKESFKGDKTADEDTIRKLFPVIVEFTGEGNALQATSQLARIANIAFIDKSAEEVSTRSAILAGDNNYAEMGTLKGTRRAGIALIENTVCFDFDGIGILAHNSYVRCLPTVACLYNGNGFSSSQNSHFIAKKTLAIHNKQRGYLIIENSIGNYEHSQALYNGSDGFYIRHNSLGFLASSLSSHNTASGYSVAGNSVAAAQSAQASHNQYYGYWIGENSTIYAEKSQALHNKYNGYAIGRNSFLNAKYSQASHNGSNGYLIIENSMAFLHESLSSYNSHNGYWIAESVTYMDNSQALHNKHNGYSTARNSTIHMSQSKSLHNGRTGILASHSHIFIDGCDSSYNQYSGIALTMATAQTNNITANENGYVGIYLDYHAICKGTKATIHKNGHEGIKVYSGSSVFLTEYDIQHNKLTGAIFYNAGASSLHSSIINNNESYGVHIINGASIRINNCKIEHNKTRPIYIPTWGNVEFTGGSFTGTASPAFNVMNSYGGIIKR